MVIAEVGVGPLPMCWSALFWERQDIHFMLFEPNKRYFDEVKAAAGARTNVEMYNVAIGEENTVMKLYDEGTSAALEGVSSPFAQHHKVDPATKPYHMVDVRRISEFDHGQIDVLRVDVEGHEWACIKHMVSRPQQIVVETYNDLGTYINPHLYEICEWAKVNGYRRASVQDSDFTYVRR